MAKKTAHNQKILLMTDSASDISDQDLTEGGIVMLPIPITIDGKGYYERVDFTIPEFYERLSAAKELPVTSHILSLTYQQAYEDAYAQGYTDIINTTITSAGSNMFEAAVLTKSTFSRSIRTRRTGCGSQFWTPAVIPWAMATRWLRRPRWSRPAKRQRILSPIWTTFFRPLRFILPPTPWPM